MDKMEDVEETVRRAVSPETQKERQNAAREAKP
jgi:hypothetical protein